MVNFCWDIVINGNALHLGHNSGVDLIFDVNVFIISSKLILIRSVDSISVMYIYILY